MNLLHLAWKSLLNRRSTALLTMLTVAVSVALLLGVEKTRLHARQSFANTVSGTDLIVGARSGSVQLLLYSVFRIGNATNNISWESYQEITALPGVRWAIPISLGDSHRGYRVVGTTRDYFEHFRYANKRRLEFSAGQVFEETYDAVLGAEVARQLDYQSGDRLILTHGLGADGLAADHTDKPFTISGILAPTGTPVDRSVHVSLAGIEAIHINWNKIETDPTRARSSSDLRPRAITAFMLGLDSRLLAFKLQREINQYTRRAAAGDISRRRAAGTVGPDAGSRTGAAHHIPAGRGGCDGGLARGIAGCPQRTSAGNGDTTLGRRKPPARHGIASF